jgi:hypothetical protein
MSITAEYVSEIFKGLEEGDGASFFSYVDDNVDWSVEGTHPLATIIPRWPSSKEPSPSWAKVLPKGLNWMSKYFGQRGRYRGGASFPGDGKERPSVRQPLLLGALFQRQDDRRGARVPGLSHGDPPL